MTRAWKRNPESDDLVAALVVVRDLFRDCGIDYRLIGGLALELQGVETGTTDVDLMVGRDDYEAAKRCLEQSDLVTPQRITTDGERVDAKPRKQYGAEDRPAEATVYLFDGSDGGERPVAFFRVNDIEVDLLGAGSAADRNAIEDVPMFTQKPRGVPVAQVGAVVAIKLSVAREKDLVHVENVARVLGKKRGGIINRYLERLGFTDLADEWDAAVLRATVPPRER